MLVASENTNVRWNLEIWIPGSTTTFFRHQPDWSKQLWWVFRGNLCYALYFCYQVQISTSEQIVLVLDLRKKSRIELSKNSFKVSKTRSHFALGQSDVCILQLRNFVAASFKPSCEHDEPPRRAWFSKQIQSWRGSAGLGLGVDGPCDRQKVGVNKRFPRITKLYRLGMFFTELKVIRYILAC